MNIPCTFFSNEFRQEDHVVHARVLTHEELSKNDQWSRLNRKVTRLAIVKNYSGKTLADTILFYHGDGSMCFRGLPSDDLGSEYILRISRLTGGLDANTIPSEMYRMELCANSLLRIENKRVKGNITRNRKCKKRRRQIERQLNSEKSNGQINHEKLTKGKSWDQRFRLTKFERSWRKKFEHMELAEN